MLCCLSRSGNHRAPKDLLGHPLAFSLIHSVPLYPDLCTQVGAEPYIIIQAPHLWLLLGFIQ